MACTHPTGTLWLLSVFQNKTRQWGQFLVALRENKHPCTQNWEIVYLTLKLHVQTKVSLLKHKKMSKMTIIILCINISSRTYFHEMSTVRCKYSSPLQHVYILFLHLDNLPLQHCFAHQKLKDSNIFRNYQKHCVVLL